MQPMIVGEWGAKAPRKGIDLLANQERGYVFGSDSSSNRAESPAF